MARIRIPRRSQCRRAAASARKAKRAAVRKASTVRQSSGAKSQTHSPPRLGLGAAPNACEKRVAPERVEDLCRPLHIPDGEIAGLARLYRTNFVPKSERARRLARDTRQHLV